MEHFSEREEKIINAIGAKKLTLEEISSLVFKNEQAPFDDKITISNSIRRINDKCIYYKLPWTIHKKKFEKKMTFCKLKRCEKTTLFTVKKTIRKNGYPELKFASNGYDWNREEMEEVEKIDFIFSNNMTDDEITKIKSKFAHKM